jgi:hypothetical protein
VCLVRIFATRTQEFFGGRQSRKWIPSAIRNGNLPTQPQLNSQAFLAPTAFSFFFTFAMDCNAVLGISRTYSDLIVTIMKEITTANL